MLDSISFSRRCFTIRLYITARQKIFKEFIHDVKSPLAVLKIFFASRNENEKHTQVINSALDRIENMVQQIDRPSKDEPQTKFKVISALHEVLDQKKIEYSDLRISYDISNNTYEAYSSESKKTSEELINPELWKR